VILVLGGARSGKSEYAKKVAIEAKNSVVFIATGKPIDREMKERIEKHRALRPREWRTIECERNVAKAMEELNKEGDKSTIIIDCITFLVNNLIYEATADTWEKIVDEEISAIIKEAEKREVVIIVSNEVGLGLVPAAEISRRYRDILGSANQSLAAKADEVYFMMAGLPIKIKEGCRQR